MKKYLNRSATMDNAQDKREQTPQNPNKVLYNPASESADSLRKHEERSEKADPSSFPGGKKPQK